MPELPEVETICQGLKKLLCGQVIREVKLQRANLRYPFPYMMPERLQRTSIHSVRRRAKYILINLSTNETWLIHLGMSGKFHQLLEGEALRKHDHMLLVLENGNRICYSDPRRFGYMALMPTEDVKESIYCKNLGLEPLDEGLTYSVIQQRFLNSTRPIKTALLEQHRLVGLGNIYVCESLWLSKINPLSPSNTITVKQWKRLFPAIQSVLRNAILVGGSTLKDYKRLDGTQGYFQHQFSVYDQAGRACQNTTCTGTIKRIVQSGRSTFYCPSCQK